MCTNQALFNFKNQTYMVCLVLLLWIIKLNKVSKPVASQQQLCFLSTRSIPYRPYIWGHRTTAILSIRRTKHKQTRRAVLPWQPLSKLNLSCTAWRELNCLFITELPSIVSRTAVIVVPYGVCSLLAATATRVLFTVDSRAISNNGGRTVEEGCNHPTSIC